MYELKEFEDLQAFTVGDKEDDNPSTHMNDTSDDDREEEHTNLVIMLLLLFILFIISSCVNITILVAFYKKKSLRTISYR
jgi:uncharacterized membrane protein